MRVHRPLDDLIGGKTSLRVLRSLSLFPGKEFTGRELAGVAGGAPSKVIAELERLKGLGMVTRRTIGRAHSWKLNADHALVLLLAPVFEEEDRLPQRLMEELERGLDDARISRAVLFGSFARSEETPRSDVDLLVLTKRAADLEDVRATLDALSVRLASRFGLRLAPLLYAERELPRLRRTALMARIADEGRVVRGAGA